MSYSDFINYWKESNKKWENYRKDVLRVIDAIYDYFIEELQVDTREDYLKIFPPKEQDTKTIITTLYNPFFCIDFENSGWANIGLLLSFKSNENGDTKQYFRFKFFIKATSMVEPKKWKVKIAEDGNEHLISNQLKEDELKEIWDEFDNLVKASTLYSLDYWLGVK